VANGCLDAIFAGSVSRLHQDGRLDTAVIHGDGTTTAAKRGGDNLGFSGHKKMKGDKVVAFCDRHCNVITPFVAAPGNRNESPLLREALPEVMRIAREVGLDLQGAVVSLDGVYDCRANRKAIFSRGMVPNINPNPRGRKQPKRGRKRIFEPAIFKERFRTIERIALRPRLISIPLYQPRPNPAQTRNQLYNGKLGSDFGKRFRPDNDPYPSMAVAAFPQNLRRSRRYGGCAR
jgi:hypothetical protein